jgi:hypothetical protein
VTYWESGAAVPDGMRRERLAALLEGKLWPELRASLIAGVGLPKRWDEAVRWYRRLSREREPRAVVGVSVAAVLTPLRSIDDEGALREQYGTIGAVTTSVVADRGAPAVVGQTPGWRIIEAAYGLRWLEIRHRLQLDIDRSLARQLWLTLLNAAQREAIGDQ